MTKEGQKNLPDIDDVSAFLYRRRVNSLSTRSLWIAAALLLAITPSARAEKVLQVLTVPTQIEGYVPDRETWQRNFDERISNSLNQVGYQEVRVKPADAGCQTEVCLESLRAKYKVDGVLAAKVRSNSALPPDYTLEVSLLDPKVARPVQKRQFLCARCAELATAEKLHELAIQTLNEVPTESPRLTVKSDGSSGKKIALYTVGAVASAMAIAGAIGLGLTLKEHDQPNCGTLPTGIDCSTRKDATTGIIISAAGLGVGVIVAPIAFALAATTKNKHQVQILPQHNGILLTGAF